ncbi:MAG: hypothetical protein P8N02_07790 [Actinomycetota bacterium]|jgi:hypothetical protein|nr:hypothetical protein [Actinomycetota bacterium]
MTPETACDSDSLACPAGADVGVPPPPPMLVTNGSPISGLPFEVVSLGADVSALGSIGTTDLAYVEDNTA